MKAIELHWLSYALLIIVCTVIAAVVADKMIDNMHKLDALALGGEHIDCPCKG